MSPEEAPPSSHAADQAWFSMLLANDPNTALVRSLRPARRPTLWAALWRPFERPVPLLALDGLEGSDEIARLRPRSPRWVGAGLLLLALGVVFAGVRPDAVRMAATEARSALAALQGESLVTATSIRVAPAPPPTVDLGGSSTPDAPVTRNVTLAIAANVAPATAEPRAPAESAASASPAKTTRAARPLRRESDRAWSRPRAAR